MENVPSCSKHTRDVSEEKQKKSRRKPRHKKDNLKEALILPNFRQSVKHKPQKSDKKPNFTIEPIRIQPGIVYRKRNPNCNFINVAALNQTTKPQISQTNPDNLTAQLKKLSVKPANSAKKRPKRKPKSLFPAEVSMLDVYEGLTSGRFMHGTIRINPKKSTECYVANEDKSKADYTITSITDRNRAMEGDDVVFELKRTKNKEDNARLVHIICILKAVHPRTAVGHLTPMSPSYALFTPRDKRIPKMRIPATNCPSNFRHSPKTYKNVLFLAKLVEWNDPLYADGLVLEELGTQGDLPIEMLAILKEFTLDTTPFTKKDLSELDLGEITPEIIANRQDLRHECTFTIDPQTARDLDDAVSCKLLENGNFLVGVHISDVSHYLSEHLNLNKLVEKKATTIYLTDNVHHMLPLELCMHCSLLPNEPKLAFSVFWEMTESAEILSKTVKRTVIKSCAQLAYEHAQHMIDNEDGQPANLPAIYGFTYKQLSFIVNNLRKLAGKLREKRMQNGALRIDQIKIGFDLDPDNGKPIGLHIYEIKEAHRLIEEFMLLANITVAEWLYEKCPKLALLRCHDVPKQSMLEELQQNMETVGIFLDIGTSGGLNASLSKYQSEDFLGQCRWTVLNHLLAKPMVRARYFCAGSGQTSLGHYALSVPLYTHFTSPIRRYADVVVHRLLAASLGYREMPSYTVEKVAQIAENCNRQKYNAKRAGESSADVFLAYFVDENQPFITDGVVVDVKDRSFDIIVLKTGSVIRLFANNFDSSIKWVAEQIKRNRCNEMENDGKKMWRIIIDFPKTDSDKQCFIVLEMFSVVKVELFRKKDTNKLDAKLLRAGFCV